MAGDLKAPVCHLEGTDPFVATAVLRVDKFFKDIEMRRLDARSESVADALGKLADLGQDPAKQIGGQQNGGQLA